MTLQEFLKNNTKINEGENLPDDLLTQIYESIQQKEFSTPPRNAFLNDFNEWFWRDINSIKYQDKKLGGEIDPSLLLDLNDLTKSQLSQRTGSFIQCTGLNPVLLKYVIKLAVNSFDTIIEKSQLNCILVLISHKKMEHGEI